MIEMWEDVPGYPKLDFPVGNSCRIIVSSSNPTTKEK